MQMGNFFTKYLILSNNRGLNKGRKSFPKLRAKKL